MDTLADVLENLFYYIKPSKKATAAKPLLIERLIDSSAKPVYVGVSGGDQHQVIRIGHYPEPVHALRSFVRTDEGLKYSFEDDIALTLKKQPDGTVAYSLVSPEFMQHSVMRIPYKTISMSSEELDAIAGLIK
jgi:hypothetical protein